MCEPLKVEYYFLDETTGDTQEIAEDEGREPQYKVKDNQLLVQFELNF